MTRWAVLAAPLAAGCSAPKAYREPPPDRLTAAAAAGLRANYAAQADAGRALAHTVYDTHFDGDRLHPAGGALLDRLARDHATAGGPGPLCVYVQSRRAAAAPGPGGPLDAARAAAVADHLAGRWPDVPARVAVADHRPVGLDAAEAVQAYTAHMAGAAGTIPDRQVFSSTTSPFGGNPDGSIGGGFPTTGTGFGPDPNAPQPGVPAAGPVVRPDAESPAGTGTGTRN